MKKLKLDLKGIGELLSKEQMKMVVGGDDYGDYAGAKKCTSNSDCGNGEKCVTLVIQGVTQGYCKTISVGTACTANADCGNNQECRANIPPISGSSCAWKP